MSRISRAAALAFILMFPGAGLAASPEATAPQTTETPEADSPLKGTVGVCVRWGADDHHVEEAVVVKSSGNPLLDATIPETLRALTWQRPDGDEGDWLGLNVSVDGAPPAAELPSCDGLRQAGTRPQTRQPQPSTPSGPPAPLPKGMHRA